MPVQGGSISSTIFSSWFKFYFDLFYILIEWLTQNYAQGMTAVLSWYKQKFVWIGFTGIE